MGMIRKLSSISSIGLVSYSAPREKQANAAMKVATAEAKLLKAQRKALK